MKAEVRKSKRHIERWIADIVGNDEDYIYPDGTTKRGYFNYKTKAEAQAAVDLYHAKQDIPQSFSDLDIDPTEIKPTNPKDALGIKKAPMSTLPTGPMYEVALAMLEGARKYGRHNYRVMGVKASVYYDAAMGHLTAWWEGEDTDSVSGLHHLAKAMACLAVVRDSEMMGNWVDDRPPRYPDASKLMRNHPAVTAILKQYPECKRPFTWKADRIHPAPMVVDGEVCH